MHWSVNSARHVRAVPARTAMWTVLALPALAPVSAAEPAEPPSSPPAVVQKVRVDASRPAFVLPSGKPFLPMGVNYFRPGTGWAPQVWKQFDPEAARKDFARLRALGANCVRVFLTYGSFYSEPGRLDPAGLEKLDRFLALAEEAGLYVHPTGPDHWEGTPEWARGDRYADEPVLEALEAFWRLLAARYRGRPVLFAYDLLNEPEIRWESPSMTAKWRAWVVARHGSVPKACETWGLAAPAPGSDDVPRPARDAAPGRHLLDYQHFREDLADDWTRRQARAIKAVDPDALVTVGLIQWSVPVLLAAPWQYSGFRPERQAPLLDFLEVHFYPLARGFYEYTNPEDEGRNLAYLEAVVRAVAKPGKPVVLAEFGWYGGGKPSINEGRHPLATEDQQARWCRLAVETTAGWATGWLNWGFYDHPGARDVTEFIGLLTADGRTKAWGRAFQELSARYQGHPLPAPPAVRRPDLDWDRLIADRKAMDDFREAYYQAWKAEPAQRAP